jgi:hypothetical protein
MVPVLSEAPDDVLLCSTVWGDFVGPGNCHLLAAPGRLLPSDEVLFYLAREHDAKVMLFGSRAAGSIFEVGEEDMGLTERLLAAAARNNIEVIDHLLVKDGMFRFMSCTDLWVPGTRLDPGT